jgi:pimeloyl-ACP methyl ester carboxylesterase
MIALAWRRGYRRIILAGHSTGASKALYYQWKAKDRRVKGVMLLGPASDIAGELKRVTSAILIKRVKQARVIARRQPHHLVPAVWGPWSASRYVSLFTPGGVEDLFPYHRLGGRWSALRSVRVPLLIVFGQRDEYLDRSAEDVMRMFKAQARSSRSVTTVVIPRAGHGFTKHHDRLAAVIRGWLRAHA